MGSIRFREATAADAAAVMAIKRAAIRRIASWTYDPEQIDAWAPDSDALSDFETALDHERFSAVVAVDEDAPEPDDVDDGGAPELDDEADDGTDDEAANEADEEIRGANGDEVVGYGVLDTSEATIVAAYVHPDRTGEGIATSLVRQLEMRARMAGLDSVAIAASKNAISFYESIGYERQGTATLPIDEVDVEFERMEKTLDATAEV